MILSLKNKTLVFILLIYFSSITLMRSQNAAKDRFATAADRPELYLPLLKNKNVIIAANQTSLLKDKKHLVDFLVENKVKIKSIFAPEHGFRGTADAGEKVDNTVDPNTGKLTFHSESIPVKAPICVAFL